MESFEITLISVNDDGRKDKYIVLENDLVNATRIVLTYKPKKGYELDEINIVKGHTLL